MTSKRGSSKSKLFWLFVLLGLALAAYIYLNNQPKENTPRVQSTSTQTVQGTSTHALTADYFEIYFTNPNDPNDNTVEQALIKKIDNAKTSIDLAVFEFDIESVAEALIRAQDRGVAVRIVYDNEYSDPDPQIGEVKAAGISAVPDNRSAYMHNKFFVFDNNCIWTGSFNITNNASHKNNENAIYFCSKEAAANYRTEFSEMYAGEFGKTSSKDTPYPTFVINGIKIANCFASEDECMTMVIDAVNTAESTIHFLAFSFTYDDLSSAMIQRAQNGVTVEGVFETRGANADSSECNTLLNKGFDIRLDGNKGTMHEKVIIVDNAFVIFGSYNFTSSADNNNDENLLIWYDPALAAIFEQEYQKVKANGFSPTGSVCAK